MQHLTSSEIRPGTGGRLDALVLEYQGKVRAIEQAEFQSDQARQEAQRLADDYKRWQIGANKPGAQPLNRGEAGPRPVPANEEAAIAQVQEEMMRRGLGRI